MDLTQFTLLLEKLAYDDEFRQALLANPKQTLTNMGIDPQTVGLPEPLTELPSKEALQQTYADREKLYPIYQHTQTGPFNFFV